MGCGVVLIGQCEKDWVGPVMVRVVGSRYDHRLEEAARHGVIRGSI